MNVKLYLYFLENSKPNSMKRKTGVVGQAPILTNQNLAVRQNKKVAVQDSSTDSSSQSESKG